MELNEVVNTLNNLKKGAFTRIVYQSSPTLTAAAKKSGIEIVKHTQKVVRFGVSYHNIDAVQKSEKERTTPKIERAPWCHWVIEDALAKHNTKEEYYVSFASVNGGHHTKTEWFLNGVRVSKEDIVNSGYVIPSYFKSSGEPAVVQKVNVTNVIHIGN